MSKKKAVAIVLLGCVMGFVIGRLFAHFQAVNRRETNIISIPGCKVEICDGKRVTITGAKEFTFEAELVNTVDMPENFIPTIYIVTDGYGSVKKVIFFMPCNQTAEFSETI